MATTAARAARLALAVGEIEAATQVLAGAVGVAAPALPASRDPVIAQAAQLETLAAFVRQVAAAITARESKPARNGKG